MHPYAELHCVSNFSFLRGASHAEELVARAHELGYASLAITDECSLAGVVRAHLEAKRTGMALLIGAEFNLVHRQLDVGISNSISDNSPDDFRLVLIAQNRRGYGQLSSLITRARMRAKKGVYELIDEDFEPSAADPSCLNDGSLSKDSLSNDPLSDCLAILLTPWIATNQADATAQMLAPNWHRYNPAVLDCLEWRSCRLLGKMNGVVPMKRSARLPSRVRDQYGDAANVSTTVSSLRAVGHIKSKTSPVEIAKDYLAIPVQSDAL